MSIEERVKATAKDIEGKVQEAIGDVFDNPEQEAEGKAKQAQAKVQYGLEDAKDEVKKVID